MAPVMKHLSTLELMYNVGVEYWDTRKVMGKRESQYAVAGLVAERVVVALNVNEKWGQGSWA